MIHREVVQGERARERERDKERERERGGKTITSIQKELLTRVSGAKNVLGLISCKLLCFCLHFMYFMLLDLVNKPTKLCRWQASKACTQSIA